VAKIGVLALQGAFIEHIKMLRSLGAEAFEVRLPQELEDVDGLIIPGGESTTIGKLVVQYNLVEPIRDMAKSGLPMWGTCAGMIMLARDIGGLNQPLIGVMDVKVARNAFGRQIDSFEVDIDVPALARCLALPKCQAPLQSNDTAFRAIFIRAPLIKAVGQGVEVLARLEDGTIVAARQNNLLVTAFHPELTDDLRFHRYFLAMI
jgi:5'-phosphate synthase pdxT subunit